MQKVQLIFKKLNKGFSLVETILALSLFALLVTALVGTYLYGEESTALSGSRNRATFLAEEGIEAVRNIRDQNSSSGGSFSALTAGNHGLAVASGQWGFSGVNDTNGIYTRQITVSDVDSNRKDITSTVSWQQNLQRPGVVTLTSHLSNWNALSGPVTIFYETFPNQDSAWNGTADTAQDEAVWHVYQGNGDNNDVRVNNTATGSLPSGSRSLVFNDADEGFGSPEQYDIAYIPIDLSPYQNVNISYYWQSSNVDVGEGLRVAYSTDTTNGIDGTWNLIAEYLNPTDDVWTQESFNLSNINAVSTFVLRFSSKSNANNENMYVGDILITGDAI